MTVDQVQYVQAFYAAEPAAAAQIDAFLTVNDYLADPPPGYTPDAPDAWDLLDEQHRSAYALIDQPWPTDTSHIKHRPDVATNGDLTGVCICGRKLVSERGVMRPWCKIARPC